MRTFFPFAALLLLVLSSCNNNDQTPAENSTGWTLGPFNKADSVNPILLPDSASTFRCPVLNSTIKWEEKDVFNPAAVLRNDTIFLLYRAEDRIGKYAGTSRIGLAWSTDGLHFTKKPQPVLYPDNDDQKKWEWEGGCEDPRVVEGPKGNYIMTYTAYDGDKARLMVATSPDLQHWTKHGPAFAGAFDNRYVNKWTKSGSIICRFDKGTPVAARIHGKYWMYWGDVNIWAATSSDLVHWTPVQYENGEKPPIPLRHNAAEVPELQIVFGPRQGKFDSDLVEPGPPAMLTEKGILLLYNSRNVRKEGDSSLAEGTYAASQILMDANDPVKVLQRLDAPFIKPDKPFEISGQVNQVCFIEGLVKLRDHWYLYYGTADSKIAVAVK